ncbi:MAG: hypothetical protein AAFO15_01075 [Pseudomonadota bacterium]
MLNSYIQRLIDIFAQLPNLSENNARKIVLSLLNKSKGILHILTQVENKLSLCLCGNIDELINNQCTLCNKKNNEKILIILSLNDLFTLENSGIYEGQYHIVCNHNISLTNLRIDELITRIKNTHTKEIIFALSHHYLSSTIEKFICKQLKQFTNLKITKIQTGVPVGSNLNNENESTLKAALLSRQEISNNFHI